MPTNDIDLERWKDYPDIITDSLWLLGARDSSGLHRNDFHGNFVPQIPHQAITRFTQTNDLVVDLFCGSGTTLLESIYLNRFSIGVDICPTIVEKTKSLITEATKEDVSKVFCYNSMWPGVVKQVKTLGQTWGFDNAQLVILHPPYWDIVKFSNEEFDLSHCRTLEKFLENLDQVVCNAREILAPDRYLCLVIGDLYKDKELIPLGFECMNLIRQKGFMLKAINVKDIQGNEKAKGKNNNLWRYRALAGDFYVFKHEYIMFFKRDHNG